MARSDLRTETRFSQPIRQIVWMTAVLALVGAGTWVAVPTVAPIFAANPWLNGVILAVFVLGVIACFAQVLMLFKSVGWIEGFAARRETASLDRPPSLLRPLAVMLRARSQRSEISTASSRSILDSIAQRMDEARDITRYIVNTLIFLGLLGTFWGLATTVPAVVDTIRNLNPTDGEGSTDVFGRLIAGLEDQLAGMGTAFASSLLGLAGSLVVGLLELFAGHGQNRFYNELEDWLGTITRIGLVDDGETIDQYSLAAVLDHMNAQMERLQDMFQEAEDGRRRVDDRLAALSDALTESQAQGNHDVAQVVGALHGVANGQGEIVAALRAPQSGADGRDMESRMRLRSIDAQLSKVFQHLERGESVDQAVAELRSDVSSLTRTMRQLNRLIGEAQARRVPPQPQDG